MVMLKKNFRFKLRKFVYLPFCLPFWPLIFEKKNTNPHQNSVCCKAKQVYITFLKTVILPFVHFPQRHINKLNILAFTVFLKWLSRHKFSACYIRRSVYALNMIIVPDIDFYRDASKVSKHYHFLKISHITTNFG